MYGSICWPTPGFKGRTFSSGFSTDGTLISASAAPHYGYLWVVCMSVSRVCVCVCVCVNPFPSASVLKSHWSCCLVLTAACLDEVRCFLQVLAASQQLLPQLWPCSYVWHRRGFGAGQCWRIVEGSGFLSHRDSHPRGKFWSDVSGSAVWGGQFSFELEEGGPPAGGWDQHRCWHSARPSARNCIGSA